MLTALAFSGGKDSLACWYLCRPPIVIWINTGKAYPETRAIVDMVRSQAKHFEEVVVDREAQNREHGIPADVVPVDYTTFGQQVTCFKPTLVQSYLQCCLANISLPILTAAKNLGVTRIIRGQRGDEAHKATSHDGDLVCGFTYLHPIESWTKEQVLDYLREQMGELPAHFEIEHSSLDCYDCTAYAAHSKDRVAYTQEHHPMFYSEYRARRAQLRDAIATAMRPFNEMEIGR